MSSFSCSDERSWLRSRWDVLSASSKALAPEPARDDDPEGNTEDVVTSSATDTESSSRAQFAD